MNAYKKNVSKCHLTEKDGAYAILELREIAKHLGIKTIKRGEICAEIKKRLQQKTPSPKKKTPSPKKKTPSPKKKTVKQITMNLPEMKKRLLITLTNVMNSSFKNKKIQKGIVYKKAIKLIRENESNIKTKNDVRKVLLKNFKNPKSILEVVNNFFNKQLKSKPKTPVVVLNMKSKKQSPKPKTPVVVLNMKSKKQSPIAIHVNSNKEPFNVSKGVTLAEKYNNRDPKGLMMSEKLNGVRAVWTGKELKSRSDKPIYAPSWFLKTLPINVPLNGELFLNRGKFEDTTSIVKKKVPINNEWKKVKFMAFNTPTTKPIKFSNRYNKLKSLESIICENLKDCPFQLVSQTEVKNKNHLKKEYNRVLELGGEGMMLRNPNSLYEQKRTKSLLKVKPEMNAEAIILDIIEGKGKDQGKMGALQVKLPNSVKTFKVGTGFDDKQRRNFWEQKEQYKGNTITFGYQGLTKYKVPRFPKFIRMRTNKNI